MNDADLGVRLRRQERVEVVGRFAFLDCEEAPKWDPNSDDSNALMSHEEIRPWWGPDRRRS
jgi:hypothetical protein